MRMNSSVTLTIKSAQQLQSLRAALLALGSRKVLVGFPRATAGRKDGEEINNAALGYIHNFGAPEANIPQREFMRPGFQSVLPEVIELYKVAAKAACATTSNPLIGSSFPELDRALNRIGLTIQVAIKKVIRAGLSPPIAEATVARRIARRKNKKWRRERQLMVEANIQAGLAPGAGIFTPLIDTAGMINAITYVIRRNGSETDLITGPTQG